MNDRFETGRIEDRRADDAEHVLFFDAFPGGRTIVHGRNPLQRSAARGHAGLTGINATNATHGMTGIVLEGAQGRFSV